MGLTDHILDFIDKCIDSSREIKNRPADYNEIMEKAKNATPAQINEFTKYYVAKWMHYDGFGDSYESDHINVTIWSIKEARNHTHSCKAVIVENNGKYFDFLTNIPIEKEALFAQDDYDKICREKCICVSSLKQISKVDAAKILTDIKNNNFVEAYCAYMYRLQKNNIESAINCKKKKTEEQLKEEYFNNNADDILNSFAKSLKKKL